MALVGTHVAVGSPAPETGRYRHAACGDTAIFNKGNIMAPCSNRQCPHRGGEWVLIQKLT